MKLSSSRQDELLARLDAIGFLTEKEQKDLIKNIVYSFKLSMEKPEVKQGIAQLNDRYFYIRYTDDRLYAYPIEVFEVKQVVTIKVMKQSTFISQDRDVVIPLARDFMFDGKLLMETHAARENFMKNLAAGVFEYK